MANDVVTNPKSNWSLAAQSSGGYLQGDAIKFRDGRYYIGKSEKPAPEDFRLAVIDVVSAWVRWEDGKPAEQIEQTPDKVVTRDMLGHDNEDEWEDGINGPRDPWQDTRYLYLIDPKTAISYTFVTTTIGGKGAIRTLAAQIERVQRVQPGALPFIQLRFADMKTQWGSKAKPFFEVVGWTQGVGASAPIEPGKMTIESGKKPLEPIDDDIPF